MYFNDIKEPKQTPCKRSSKPLKCKTKDNFDGIPVDKWRKSWREAHGSLKMAGPNMRTRQAFLVVNASQESLGNPNNGGLAANQPLNNGNVDCGLIEFTKEDVEVLLNEKMKGENKFDYKGKPKQMQEYINKLCLCIRWFQEHEKYLLQQETLQKTLEAVESKHAEIEAQMKNKEEELNRIVAKLIRDNASL